MEPQPRPRPSRTASPGLIAIFVVIGISLAAVVGSGAWLGWKVLKHRKRATEAELAEEREQDKAATLIAFNSPVRPTADEKRGFQQLFDQIGSALERGDAATVNRRFDANRFQMELYRVGALDNLPASDRRALARGVAEGARKTFGQNLVANPIVRWDHTEIRHVRWSPDRHEAVVIAVHQEGEGAEAMRSKMRWWLIEHDGAWNIYDFEDLEVGMRTSLLIGSLATPQFIKDFEGNTQWKIDQMKRAIADIQTAMVSLTRQDAAEAERALARSRGVLLPGALGSLRELAEGILLAQQGKLKEALMRYEESERLLPNMPILRICRASSLIGLGQHEQALGQARAYIDDLGADPIALGLAGAALEGLERPAEALDAYRQGLDEDPDDSDCLHGLRRTLPEDKKAELTERLGRCSKPTEAFEELLKEARSDNDAAGIKALMAWLRKKNPNDPRVATEELQELVRDKKFSEAAARLRKLLTTAKSEERSRVLNTYLNAMFLADRSVEAYAAVPKEDAAAAFRTLANTAMEDLDEGPKEAMTKAEKTLRMLIDARRKQAPADPSLWLYEGTILQVKNQFGPAERQFAEGMNTLEKAGSKNPDADYLRMNYRWRRVECLYRLKQGLKAYAEVGPADATFNQLANRYDGDGDIAGLEALVAAHRKANPSALALKFWSAQILFLKKQYAAAAVGFHDYHAGNDKGPEWYRSGNRWLCSLIRAGDVRGARRAAAELGADKTPIGLRAALEALDGNLAALEALLAAQAKEPGGLWMIYGDEDFRRLTAGPRFAELLKKYPDPRPKTAGEAG